MKIADLGQFQTGQMESSNQQKNQLDMCKRVCVKKVPPQCVDGEVWTFRSSTYAPQYLHSTDLNYTGRWGVGVDIGALQTPSTSCQVEMWVTAMVMRRWW